MTRRFLIVILLCIPSVAAAAFVHPILRAAMDPTSPPLPASLVRSSNSPLTGETDLIGVWVHTRDGGHALETQGLLGTGRPRNLRAAIWTREQIRRAAEDPSVVSLMPAVRCEASLDSSLAECGGTAVHEAHGSPPNYVGLTGHDVIVGIVDSGIDLIHEDFQDDLGHTRLVSLWDQTTPSSDPPRNFDFGKEWTAAQIDLGLATETDPSGHGTHVAGIAAGNGRATGNAQPQYRYVGMAPDAPIVAVKTDYMTTSVAMGVDYVFQKADSLGMPAVVNLSLGTHYGPHDGTDDFALSVAALTGPGHTVVAAAGNERGKGYHARRIFSPPDSASVSFSVPSYTANEGSANDEIDIDAWYTGGTAISFTVVTPNGYDVGPVVKGASIAVDTPDGHVEVDNSMSGPLNGDENVFFWIYDRLAPAPPASGTWRILMQAEPVSAIAVASTFDAWIFYRTMPGNLPFLVGVDERFLVASPASSDSVISVGAYATKASWTAADGNTYGYSPAPTLGAIATFSSVGPRRDSVLKPDVTAPGQGIGAALSTATSVNPHAILLDGVHVVFQGTSMSCPHVAGVAALMFERLGRLSVREMAERIRGTARRDSFTGPNPNTTYGYGKIDALGATGYVVPVLLEQADAVQVGSRVEVRFRLGQDVEATPFEVFREGPANVARSSIGWTSTGQDRVLVDSTLVEPGEYRYWLRVPAPDGSGSWAGPAGVTYVPAEILSRLELGPNPFVDHVRLRWSAPAAPMTATIFDLTGRRVRRLQMTAEAGTWTTVWDGRSDAGRITPAGVYLLRVRGADGQVEDRRVMRLR
jgi:subtilisin family serine protease